MTHPELKASFFLPIIGVKKNPSSVMYTSLGVITKGTIIEVILRHRTHGNIGVKFSVVVFLFLLCIVDFLNI